MTGLGGLEFVKLAIYFASYLYFPAAIILVVLLLRMRGRVRLACGLAFVGLTVLAYARFIEPRILMVNEHEIALNRCFPRAAQLRLAVLSDMHIGLFAHAMPIERIAARIDENAPDAVLVAGDFVYFLHPDRIEQTFAPLGALSAPVYAVLGNHDIGLPGPDLTSELTQSLSAAGLTIIDDQKSTFRVRGVRYELVGLSDLWADSQKMGLLHFPSVAPRLVLTHNPATVQHIPKQAEVDLLFAGHTHGGQIYIPFFTCAVIDFACRIARYGYSDKERAPVFVTSGTGMVGLPFRFNAPPRIDMVTVTLTPCDA